MISFYMIFVWNIQEKQIPTLQIIHVQDKKFDIKMEKEVPIKENPQKAEYLYVASKKGKYYYPKDCPKAKVLSVKNMLYFKDKMSAERVGYFPYMSCF